ncbi:MAG: hypothetical protein ABIA93_06710 [Candidatus Woesearchaeota archaeon]
MALGYARRTYEGTLSVLRRAKYAAHRIAEWNLWDVLEQRREHKNLMKERGQETIHPTYSTDTEISNSELEEVVEKIGDI